MTPKILDCTLRDGGYYNDWDFSPDLAASYLRAMQAAGVDAVEIGFRSLPQDKFLGPFAYSTDEFLRSLPLPRKILLGVMVNAAELLAFEGGAEAAVGALFCKASASPVKLVRVAAHFSDLDRCGPLMARLKNLGYRTGLNIMQASGKSAAELTAAAKTVSSWKAADLFYFADSLGTMDPGEVRKVLSALRRGWTGPLGVHAHNNRSQALANALEAAAAGAEWLDATVLGMGRGAGNVHTEYLLLELALRHRGRYDAEPVFALALDEFDTLRREYGWGPSPLYFLSAAYGIHPTYVQEMLAKGHYTPQQLIGAMEFLKRSAAKSYDGGQFQKAFLGESGEAEGSWDATGWADGREALVVGPGPGTRKHLDALCRFIDARKPAVLSLNINKFLPAGKVTAYLACHKTSLVMDAAKYGSLKKALIAPLSLVPEPVRRELKGIKVLDYGMSVKPDSFQAGPRGCVIPVPLVAAYALALCQAAGATKVFLAGFDGYGAADPRQAEMNKVIKTYFSTRGALPLLAVTPTTYDLPKSSVYAPAI